jgi:hypothetical protein
MLTSASPTTAKKIASGLFVSQTVRTVRKLLEIAIVLLACTAGCSKTPKESLPTTFPVTGQIVDKSGQPLTAGVVQFESTVSEKTQAMGKIQPDGSFTMTTVIGEAMAPGAIEGPHKVSFLPVGRDLLPAYFDAPFKVGPGENKIKLTYPHGRSAK